MTTEEPRVSDHDAPQAAPALQTADGKPEPFWRTDVKWEQPCGDWGGYRTGTCRRCGWSLDTAHEDGA